MSKKRKRNNWCLRRADHCWGRRLDSCLSCSRSLWYGDRFQHSIERNVPNKWGSVNVEVRTLQFGFNWHSELSHLQSVVQCPECSIHNFRSKQASVVLKRIPYISVFTAYPYEFGCWLFGILQIPQPRRLTAASAISIRQLTVSVLWCKVWLRSAGQFMADKHHNIGRTKKNI